MKIKKILLMTLLSAGLALTSCGADETSHSGNSSSESRTSESQTSSEQSSSSSESRSSSNESSSEKESSSSQSSSAENQSSEQSSSSSESSESSSEATSSESSVHTHTFASEWSKDETYHWHAATCEHVDEVQDKATHIFKDKVTAPTYDTKGFTTHTCTVCGYSYVDSETDELEHEFSDKWSYDDFHHFHACLDDGYEDEVADEAEHDFRYEVTAPTYDKEGYTTYTCTVCGYSYVDDGTEKLVHQYDNEWSYNETKHWHSCTDAGFEGLKADEADHDFEVEVTEPTYSAGGYTTHTCKECDYYYVDSETDKLVHNYSDKWSYDDDRHFHACLDDGCEDEIADEAAHTYGEWVIDKKATETEEGLKHKDCTVCGYSVYNTIDQLDHDWGTPTYKWSDDYSSCTATLVCANDTELDHVITETVDSIYEVVNAATCTENGTGRYTAKFTKEAFEDQTHDIELEATDHDYGEVTYSWSSNNSSCTAKRICKNDTKHIESETVKTTFETIKEATVTEDGQRTYTAEFTNTAFEKQVKEVVLDATGTPEKLKFELDQYSNDKAYRVSAASTDIKGEVIIPAKYNGLQVTKVEYQGFKDCGDIISVTIPSSITNIYSEAFLYCYRLTEVVNKSSLTIKVGASGNGYVANYAKQVITDPANSKLSVDSNGNVTYNDGTDIWSVGFIGEGTEAVVPSTVTKISQYSFYNNTRVTSIVLSDNITLVPHGSFQGCTALESLTIPFVGESTSSNRFLGYMFGSPDTMWYIDDYIPESLKIVILSDACTVIPQRAFDDCKYVESIIIPETVTSIGSEAFSSCTSLKSIVIPNSVTTIGAAAFNGCKSLESMTIPFVGESADATSNSAKTLFGYIFGRNTYEGGVETQQYYGQVGSEKYYIPEVLKSVTITGDRALFYGSFNNCENIEEIIISGNPTEIGGSSFGYCHSLKSIVIPNSVTKIGYSILRDCTSMESVSVPFLGSTITENNVFKYLFGTPSVSTTKVPDSIKHVTLTGEITTIASSAFSSCKNIESVVIPDTITSIGSYAFNGLSLLKTFNVPKNVTTIGDKAFCECKNLETITFEEGSKLESLGNSVFYKCSSLKSIVIPDGTKSIGYALFDSCTNITSIVIPDSVTSISSTYSMFSNCLSLEDLTIPAVYTSIGRYAFYYCSKLKTNIVIPSGVTSIDNYAFTGSNISSLTIPNTVTSIGDYAFQGIDVETITFEEGSKFTSIGYRTFYYCTDLTSIVIPDSVTSIGEEAFRKCTALTSITFGSGVKSIGKSAFQDCTSLETITIGDNVETIGVYAFCNCSSLKSIIIPNSVTSIGDSALNSCSSLENIKFNGTIAEWELVTKPSYYYGVPDILVHCDDGDVNLKN